MRCGAEVGQQEEASASRLDACEFVDHPTSGHWGDRVDTLAQIVVNDPAGALGYDGCGTKSGSSCYYYYSVMTEVFVFNYRGER